MSPEADVASTFNRLRCSLIDVLEAAQPYGDVQRRYRRRKT